MRSKPLRCRLAFFILALGLAAACSEGDSTPEQADPDRPNILWILVDDMGYSDLGSYGGEIETPNLDSLARNGLRFTQHASTPRCAPTRDSIMTGQYQPPLRMPEHGITIAEALKASGYATLMSGKTHGAVIPGIPEMLERGFDRSYGNADGGNYFKEDARKSYLGDRVVERGEGFYKTDAETDYALRFLDQVEPGQPFFLYLAYHAPHWPLQAKPEDIRKFDDGRYLVGPEKIREDRYARQLGLGIVEPEWALSDYDGGDWDALSEQEKRRAARLMAVHAAMVHSVDYNVGRVIEKLADRGALEDTLIMFASDNGACRRDGEWGAFMGDRFGYDYKEDAEIGSADSQWGIGRSWANASNTPLRQYKDSSMEGGISTPLIVYWPKLIARAAITHQPAQIIDWMPTALAAAGVAYPESFVGRTLEPMDGVSLLPILEGKELGRQRPMFWVYRGRGAIRAGRWKAVGDPRRKMRLYDLAVDRAETHDLSEEEPERAERLRKQWNDWYTAYTGHSFGGATNP